MKILNTYASKIKDLVGAIDSGTYTLSVASSVMTFDDIKQVAINKFPRGYTYTPHGEDMELERLDISERYRLEAPFTTDLWRYLQPASKVQEKCDETAADVVEAVLTDSYWAANGVDIEAEGVTYNYFTDRVVMVRVDWGVVVYFLKDQTTGTQYITTEDGDILTTDGGDKIIIG